MSACRRTGNPRNGLPTDGGWRRPFEDSIPLPDGGQFVILRDAADYITALSKAKQHTPEWQAATEALIMAAEGTGPLLHYEPAPAATRQRAHASIGGG
jgi:hypothetical protein